MADYISAIDPSADFNTADVGGPNTGAPGTDLNTGLLRRKFNFGDQVSELAIAQDPFFRFVSKVSKRSTDDPAFKFTEKRGSWHKKYAYVTSWGATKGALDHANATVSSVNVDVCDIYYWCMIADYKNTGNIQNVLDNLEAK